jgi:hypothetical protein
MTKIAGSVSGFIRKRHGSADPDTDPHQTVMEPQHWYILYFVNPHCALGTYCTKDISISPPPPPPPRIETQDQRCDRQARVNFPEHRFLQQ